MSRNEEISGMVTLNCDMGEAFGLYHMGDDAALMPLINVANVACGFHASDFNHMRHTVRLASSMAWRWVLTRRCRTCRVLAAARW